MEHIPIADSLPVPWPWFQGLLLLTFLLHLLFMNLILGGSILTLVDFFRKKPLSYSFKSIPTLIALTINLGVPPLLFVQVLYGNLFYSSSVIMAWPWLLIIPILILAYYGAYIFVFKQEQNSALAKASLLVSTTILLIIGFFFVNNITLMQVPANWSKYFADPSGWNLNLTEPTLIPRYLHFVTASIAVAALGKAIFAKFSKKYDAEQKQEQITNGLKIFAYTTMVQFVVGIWFLIALPKNIMMQFMGENILFTILFLVSLALAGFMILTALKGKLDITFYALLSLMIVMILTRDFVRNSYLTDVFSPKSMEVTNEYGSMVLFLGAFLIGIYALYYMIIKLIKSFK